VGSDGDPAAVQPDPERKVSLWDQFGEHLTEADFARRRVPNRTYLSKSFPIRAPSQDVGLPGRFIHKVFGHGTPEPAGDGREWSEEIVIDGPRRQIKLLIAREAGRVKEIRIQRVPTAGDLEDLLTLDREGSARLINLVKLIDHVPATGETTTRIDDDLIRDLLADPEGMRTAYQRDPGKFANLITEDVTASDVIAIAGRRQQVGVFRKLLNDPAFFQARRNELGTGPEGVWQGFLETNPWILGIGLSGQLLTAWNERKLEQVVAGFSITGAGKRADALLRTVGTFSSMVFAEIKHHKTDLLESTPYRSDCWAPSRELSGGATQAQQTVHRATTEIGERIFDTDANGAEKLQATFLILPRSFLIAGDLRQLGGQDGGVHMPKLRSFELYRRNLYEPEIVTFDELLARAEWHLAEAEREVDLRHVDLRH
jgi:hypothetical protein